MTAATAIEWLGWQAGRCGDAGRAARLLGAAHGLWRTGGPLLYGSAPWSGEHDRCVAAARRGLGDRGYEAAFRQGAELSIADAVRYALGDDAPAVPHAAPARRGHRKAGVGLTPRELQVAELVAQGLSNKDIATRLVNSRRTVESHVENILRKLGFTSRTQVAGWVATNRPPTGGQP